MAFTAMVGKELLELDFDSDTPGKTILSTYVPTSCDDTASDTACTDEDSSKEIISEEEKEGVAKMKTSRPSLDSMLDESNERNGRDHYEAQTNDSSTISDISQSSRTGTLDNADRSPAQGDGKVSQKAGEPRNRFRDSLSTLQIEEAKATGRAQLGLAFEMLTMMKKRALKADPEAYQCLIDACGRVGDTNRATDLLAKMHEDGIVADGTVYACLVSAFSAESAWKKGTKEEDLPGM